METIVSGDESQIVLLLQACEANDLGTISTILTVNPELIFEEIPENNLSFILAGMGAGKVAIVDVSLTAIQNCNLSIVDYFMRRFSQQGGLCVSNIRSSLNVESFDMLEVIQRHSNLLFESEATLLTFMQVLLLYSIAKGSLIIVEFILDHYPALLDAPVLDEMLSDNDRDFLENDNLYDEANNNPLLIAVAKSQLFMCKVLLSRGADVHFRNGSNMQAIHIACNLGESLCTAERSLDIIKLLIAFGADVKSFADGGMKTFPLQCAIYRNDDDNNDASEDCVIRYLLSQGADLFCDDVYKHYSGRSTVFIEFGCPIDEHFYNYSLLEDMDHNPAYLSSARHNDSYQLVNLRLLCGCGFSWRSDDPTRAWGLYRGLARDCLLQESRKLKLAALKANKKSETAETSKPDNSLKQLNSITLPTPNYLDVIFALMEGHFISPQQQAFFFADLAFDAYKAELEEALFGILMRAADSDFGATLRLNDQHRGPGNAPIDRTMTLLHWFMEHHNKLSVAAVRYLLEQRFVDPDIRAERQHRTPLVVLSSTKLDNYSFSLAKCLIEHGADVNIVDLLGETALHHLVRRSDTCCSHQDYEPLLLLLLQASADIHQLDNSGKSAYELSRVENNQKAEKLFESLQWKKRKREGSSCELNQDEVRVYV